MSKASDALALQIAFRNGVISTNEFRARLEVYLLYNCQGVGIPVTDCGDYKLTVVPSW